MCSSSKENFFNKVISYPKQKKLAWFHAMNNPLLIEKFIAAYHINRFDAQNQIKKLIEMGIDPTVEEELER